MGAHKKNSLQSKADSTVRISKSVFVSNFSEGCTAKDPWKVCDDYDNVVDVFIPNKKSKMVKRFAFVRFIKFCEEGPNVDRVSDVEKVSETNFGDNSSIPINHIDEFEKKQSEDPFNIYRLLRKQPGDESHEVLVTRRKMSGLRS
nr:RNA-directed DNA polymerase, eukaryota, nucleotide-binding alpha-beta plait domain protein [Tanacetum cinerariifolium]